MRLNRQAAIATLLALVASLAACGGMIEQDGIPVGSTSHSLTAYQAAHDTILDTRPKATRLLAEQLQTVMLRNGVASALASSLSELEQQMNASLTDGVAPVKCPFLSSGSSESTISCKYLAERATDEAISAAGSMTGDIEQDVGQRYQTTLSSSELGFVNGWAGEAVQSGIAGAWGHAVEILRREKVCDQNPSPQQLAFKHGEEQGTAILEQTETNVLPTIPKSQCNTDIIAQTIYGEAEKAAETFLKQNPLCADENPTDLEGKVDLAKVRADHAAGLQEGLRLGKEALRVRLVSTWVCEPCTCVHRAGGGGAIQCVQGKQDTVHIQLAHQDMFSPDSRNLKEPVRLDGLTFIPQADCSEHPITVGSPLIMDLDGDGVRLSTERVSFDLAATGEPAKIPALEGADGFLALDVNGNGRIDSGAELLGNASSCGDRRCTDGIAALAQHDGNRDGVIDGRDAVYGKLRVWRDANRNGKSEARELSNLEDEGVRSISLASRLDFSFVDAHGNSATRTLVFERMGGSKGIIPDVWFSLDFESLPQDPRSSGIVTLPARAR